MIVIIIPYNTDRKDNNTSNIKHIYPYIHPYIYIYRYANRQRSCGIRQVTPCCLGSTLGLSLYCRFGIDSGRWGRSCIFAPGALCGVRVWICAPCCVAAKACSAPERLQFWTNLSNPSWSFWYLLGIFGFNLQDVFGASKLVIFGWIFCCFCTMQMPSNCEVENPSLKILPEHT